MNLKKMFKKYLKKIPSRWEAIKKKFPKMFPKKFKVIEKEMHI